jgi:phospholipase/carboxylesterase
MEERIETADSLLLFLHGYNSNEGDLMGLTKFLKADRQKTNFISLRAPEPCRGHSGGHQWFPLDDMSFPLRIDIIEKNKAKVLGTIEKHSLDLMEFVDKKVKEYGISYGRVFLLGFSQGATMAAYSGFRMKEKIGEIISCSGFIVDDEVFFRGNNFHKQRILFSYGLLDDCIGQENFDNSKYLLTKYLGDMVKIAEYPHLYHGIDFEELSDIKEYTIYP